MLSELIKPENIILNLESEDKDDVFAQMVEAVIRNHASQVNLKKSNSEKSVQLNRSQILDALKFREEQMNTCIAKGIAVPHASAACIESPYIIIGLSRQGVDYEVCSPSQENYRDSLVHLVIMILFEEGNSSVHLKILSELALLLKNPVFYRKVLNAESEKEICSLFSASEFEF